MSTVRTILAVDLGRSGCRVALWVGDGAAPRTMVTGDGIVGLTAASGTRHAEDAILAVARPVLEQQGLASVDTVGIGVAGALTASEPARELAERLCKSLSARSVALTSDAVTSHAGAFATGPGVVLAAGTGAVVIAIGPRGRFHRIDGWGPWLGDEGSGAWLGRAGLRAAVRAHDGRGPVTNLQRSAWEQFGGPEQLALELGADGANPARIVASFVPAVALAAEQGDAVALDLIGRAAAGLARSVSVGANALAAEGLTPVPVAIVGGLGRVGALLLDPLRTALEHAPVPLDFRSQPGTSLDGARALAVGRDHIHEPWVIRAEFESSAEHARG